MAEADYLKQLNREELEFLDKFNTEVYFASFQHKAPFYSGQAEKEIYKENNRRNQDVLAQGIGKESLFPIESAFTVSDGTAEDSFIELIDLKLSLNKSGNLKKSKYKPRKAS